jgi:hypothetical protein
MGRKKNVDVDELVQVHKCIERFYELKQLEKEISEEINKIKQTLENFFLKNNMTSYQTDKFEVLRQVRKNTTLKDTIEVFLKQRGLFELVAVPDKSKVENLVKTHVLSQEELKPHIYEKESVVWTVRSIPRSQESNRKSVVPKSSESFLD